MENHQMSGLEGTCALCLQTRALVNSHIIPEFFYRPLYDPKTHRYFQLSTEPGTRTVRRPKGLYEKLLCSECDGERLGALESYVRPILQGGVEIAIEDRAKFLFPNRSGLKSKKGLRQMLPGVICQA